MREQQTYAYDVLNFAKYILCPHIEIRVNINNMLKIIY